MSTRLKFLFRHYWVEMVLIPPFLVALCWFLYGDVYLNSWPNFVRMTLAWVPMSIVSPICCHWVRNTTLRKFSRFDDWPKRVLWSLAGYLASTIGFAKLTYFALSHSKGIVVRVYVEDQPYYEDLIQHHAEIVPSETAFWGLVVLSAMSVFIIATFYEGITYFEKWKAALTEAEQLEKLHLETQFQSLQSQLNPHFLFNSLNVLSSLIAENPRRAEDFVDELSNVYRYLLRSNEQELATVGEELRFIRSFFHLLQTRHGAGIELSVDVSSEISQKKLPALALQVLVENAVKHNETSTEKPLLIQIFQQGGNRVVVRNNVQAKKTQVASNRVGLSNLRERYKLLGIEGFEVRAGDGRFYEVGLPVVG